MGIWNLGSAAESIYKRVDNIPSYYSGTEMLQALNERLIYMETELGVTIGSTTIDEKYQGPLVKFGMADTLMLIETAGVDAQSVKLGELTISKGQGSASSSSSIKWEQWGEKELLNLKDKYIYFKALG